MQQNLDTPASSSMMQNSFTPDFMKKLFILISSLAVSSMVMAEDAARIFSIKTIQPDYTVYHGWPTAASLKDGSIIVAYSSRRTHIDPFGKLEAIYSRDQGATWSAPETIYDSPLDERDAGVVETKTGKIILTTFTSTAYREIYKKAQKSCNLKDYSQFEAASIEDACTNNQEWNQAVNEIPKNPGPASFILGSTSQGKTWDYPVKVPVNTPHGPVNKTDGSLLFVGRRLPSQNPQIEAWTSDDDGLTWKFSSQIPSRIGDDPRDYHEAHSVQCGNGKIIAQIRHQGKGQTGETLQASSSDNGASWTQPVGINSMGYPSHLLRISNNKILMTYASRTPPYRIYSRISTDCGENWGNEIAIYDQKGSTDFGYPSTVTLRDGKFLTVWYAVNPGQSRAQLMQATWQPFTR